MNEKEDVISMWDEFPLDYATNSQVKFRTDTEMFRFLKQFIQLEEENMTPYKRKNGYYNKKAHYLNGKKINRYIYAYIKNWLDAQ